MRQLHIRYEEMILCVFICAMLLSLFVRPTAALGTPQEEAFAVPHLDASGRAGYVEFLAGERSRAFAIAPGGTWAWVAGAASTEEAEAEALADCRAATDQRCLTYAIDDDRVFDRDAWRRAWRLPAAAARLATGTTRGYRFANLAVTTPGGVATNLAELRGRVLFVHFWGSWCLPCKVEFPELQALVEATKNEPDIAYVLLQGREPIARSRRWVKRRGLDLNLFDSGAVDGKFRLADGGTLDDRLLAPAYPMTYVLDRDGRVVFSRRGAGHRWIEYAPLLRGLAAEK